jgi:hypothetical protein
MTAEVFIMGASTKENIRLEKAKCFLLGVLVVIGILILSGAYTDTNAPGRYQLAAWGAGSIGFGAFVIDTVSGETKIVYLNTGMKAPQANNLGVPFGRIEIQTSPEKTY